MSLKHVLNLRRCKLNTRRHHRDLYFFHAHLRESCAARGCLFIDHHCVQINKRNLRSHSSKLIFFFFSYYRNFHGISEIFGELVDASRGIWKVKWLSQDRYMTFDLHERTAMRFLHVPLDTAFETFSCPDKAAPSDRYTSFPTARHCVEFFSIVARSRPWIFAKLEKLDFLHIFEVHAGRDERWKFQFDMKIVRKREKFISNKSWNAHLLCCCQLPSTSESQPKELQNTKTQ